MAHQLNTNTSTLQSVLNTINSLPEAIDITTPLSELNAANGGTAATTIDAAVDNTEAHASSQEALIAQIASALEGKVGGGGGSSIGTCTVNITSEDGHPLPNICYTTVENGNITAKNISNVLSRTIECVCGSALVVNLTPAITGDVLSGLERLYDEQGSLMIGMFYIRAYQVSAAEGEIATLQVYMN